MCLSKSSRDTFETTKYFILCCKISKKYYVVKCTNGQGALIIILLTCANTNDGMSTTLSCWPRDFEKVQASFVSYFCPNAISGLGYRMAMKGKLVVVFDKNIVWSIVRVPSMLELDFFRNWRHIHQHFKPRRYAMTVRQVFWTCTMTIGTIAMGMLQTACKFTEKSVN